MTCRLDCKQLWKQRIDERADRGLGTVFQTSWDAGAMPEPTDTSTSTSRESSSAWLGGKFIKSIKKRVKKS